jgi:hypothetical protein
MNPINLLTKGHTIRALKERPGRYKLLCSSVLPKFSSAKGQIPTASHPVPQNTQTALFEKAKPAQELQKEEVKSTFAETSPFARAAMEKRKTAEPALPVPAALTQSQPAKPGLLSQLAVIPASWADKWISRRKTPASPMETFQTELALEKVKVLRNDFSEDDLEVVMIEKKAGKKAQKPVDKDEFEELTAKP